MLGGASITDRHLRTGLLILATCFVIGTVARGVMDSYPVFLLPLVEEFGWDRKAVTGAYSVCMLFIGLSGPAIGWLFDKFGPAVMYGMALAALALATALAARTTEPWHLYLAVGPLLGLGVTGVSTVVATPLLSRWFEARLGSALAIVYTSGGIGILVFAQVSQHLVDTVGWRGGYQAYSYLLLCFLPLTLVFLFTRAGGGHPKIAANGLGPGGRPAVGMRLREALGSVPFWGLFWSFLFTGTGMFTIFVQAPAFLVEAGYSAEEAARAYGLIGLCSPVGMLLFGWLADRFGRRGTVVLSFCLSLTGTAALLPLSQGPSWIWLAVFVIGFGGTFGARGPAISAIAATMFRGAHMGRIYGFVVVGMGLGSALGSLLGGVWHDATGGYDAAIWFALASLVLGMLPFIVLPAMERR